MRGAPRRNDPDRPGGGRGGAHCGCHCRGRLRSEDGHRSGGPNWNAQNGGAHCRRGGHHQSDARGAPDPDHQNARRDHPARAGGRRRGDPRVRGDRRPHHHARGAIPHGGQRDAATRRGHRGVLDALGAIPQPPSPGLGPYGDQNGGSCVNGQRGYRVGVLEVCQQLGKAAGVLKKEPAHHCLKPRRPPINAGLSFAGSTAGTVAALPYQL